MVMEMESSRRSFDRSREPGLKKPRLADEQPNPNGRPFLQRSSVALPPAAAAARYRVNSDRDSEINDSSRGGGAYQPQPQQYHELVSQYKTALAELTFNSKPIITNLTIIAGENLHVAKAIASTVCNNILEVPSDQKLPSLYLLDSIVKNIGRDYIKYFASRLPEVFCKAYRQVDSPVHQSMRHLFGTWKGVFPPQSLQMIEKELGFAPASNGSSSGAVTSRPESQSRRPQHSIHVNPKYLEIQRLQQSSREKGMANDLTVPLANPNDDVERPDRTASIVAGRPWDASLKMHNVQRSHRETLNEPVQEKKIPALYGNIEYNSDISRNSGLGVGRTVGRVAEQGQEKQWHDAGNSIPEPISGQRNGFCMKDGVPTYSTPKPSNIDLHLQSTQSIVGKSNNAVSASWKNSEEEEFMWDMHSRLSDQDAVNLTINSKKEQWTHDGLEKLEFDNQFRKSQTGHEVVSRFDRETSSDSLSVQQKEKVSFGHRLSSPWQLRESHQTDVVMTPGNSIIHTGSEIEGYSAALGGLPLGGSSSMSRVTVRPHMGKQGSGLLANTFSGSTATFGQQRIHSLGVTSPSGQSPLLQKPPSPSFPGRYPRQQLQNSSEQDLLQSLSHPQLSGNLVHPNSRLGAPQKLQLGSQIQNPAPEPVSKIGTPTLVSSAPDPSSSFIAETSAQSSASSLLAAVMKSGVLAKITTGGPPSLNLQDVGQIPSESSIQPPIPSGPPAKVTPSRKKVTSASTLVTEDDTPVTLSVSQKKEEQPPLPSGPPSSGQTLNSVDKAPNPISNLLSSLVAKGLISASKSESLSTLPTQIIVESDKQNLSVANPSPKPISALPVSSAIQNSSTEDKLSFPKADMVLQHTESENKGFIGLEFKSDVLRELHPPVINALFDDLHRCSICGLQLKLKERLDRHMEWHNWRKRTEPDGTSRVTRRWYADSDDWIAGKAGCPYEIEFSAVADEDEPMVLADENQCVCVLCGELFEDYYSQKRKKWMFKAALNLPLLPRDDDNMVTANKNVEGPIVHVNCISESSAYDLGLASAIEMDKDG